MKARDVIEEIKKLYNEEYAKHHEKFFQTQKGGYGEGDKFYGGRVPDLRKIAKYFKDIELEETEKLVKDSYHEVRLTALFILDLKYEKAKSFNEKTAIYNIFLNNIKHINNWDLVDTTVPQVIGAYLFETKNTDKIWEFANSKSLWIERIAVLSSFYFIKKNDYNLTLELCKHFITHEHHLMHKATGWMLREVGKKEKALLTDFLDKHSKQMPRTMLRYSIEKLDDSEKRHYMKK